MQADGDDCSGVSGVWRQNTEHCNYEAGRDEPYGVRAEPRRGSSRTLLICSTSKICTWSCGSTMISVVLRSAKRTCSGCPTRMISPSTRISKGRNGRLFSAASTLTSFTGQQIISRSLLAQGPARKAQQEPVNVRWLHAKVTKGWGHGWTWARTGVGLPSLRSLRSLRDVEQYPIVIQWASGARDESRGQSCPRSRLITRVWSTPRSSSRTSRQPR